jgi:enamine deaminase RidA (YjgF/YER057c/UK114 family)
MATITRFEPGPRMSKVVVHGDNVYLAGIVPNDPKADAASQVAQVLAEIDRLLALAGTSKSKLLTATILLADMKDFATLNAAWEPWIDPANPPTRATFQAPLATPDYKVEIIVTAVK